MEFLRYDVTMIFFRYFSQSDPALKIQMTVGWDVMWAASESRNSTLFSWVRIRDSDSLVLVGIIANNAFCEHIKGVAQEYLIRRRANDMYLKVNGNAANGERDISHQTHRPIKSTVRGFHIETNHWDVSILWHRDDLTTGIYCTFLLLRLVDKSVNRPNRGGLLCDRKMATDWHISWLERTVVCFKSIRHDCRSLWRSSIIHTPKHEGMCRVVTLLAPDYLQVLKMVGKLIDYCLNFSNI